MWVCERYGVGTFRDLVSNDGKFSGKLSEMDHLTGNVVIISNGFQLIF